MICFLVFLVAFNLNAKCFNDSVGINESNLGHYLLDPKMVGHPFVVREPADSIYVHVFVVWVALQFQEDVFDVDLVLDFK